MASDQEPDGIKARERRVLEEHRHTPIGGSEACLLPLGANQFHNSPYANSLSTRLCARLTGVIRRRFMSPPFARHLPDVGKLKPQPYYTRWQISRYSQAVLPNTQDGRSCMRVHRAHKMCSGRLPGECLRCWARQQLSAAPCRKLCMDKACHWIGARHVMPLSSWRFVKHVSARHCAW